MKKLTALLLFFLMCFAEAKVELCNFSFLANSQEDPSTLFISYLDFLNERKVLNVDELEEVLVRLESGELINPFEFKVFNKENKIYGEIFHDYINNGIDEVKVKAYLESIVRREQQTKEERDRTKEAVEDLFLPLKFGEITPDSSKGNFGIGYSLEVMTTPVTYAHWNTVFNKPFSWAGSVHGDEPKTKINFFSQAVFADILSMNKGFEPVFGIDFSSGLNSLTAFEGKLELKDSELFNMKSLITKKQGYRLPTQNEQRLLLQKAIDFIGEKDFEKRVGDYAYLSHNSNFLKSPVGTKKAYLLNNTEFYDLIGNVIETHLVELSFRRNFLFRDINYRAHSGTGSSLSRLDNFQLEHYEGNSTDWRHNLGFRLVRTIKK